MLRSLLGRRSVIGGRWGPRNGVKQIFPGNVVCVCREGRCYSMILNTGKKKMGRKNIFGSRTLDTFSLLLYRE